MPHTRQQGVIVTTEQLKNEILNAVFFDCDEAVYVKDASGVYILANDAAAELLGLTVKDIVGKTDKDFRSADEAQSTREIDEHVLVTGESPVVERSFVANGKTRIVRVIKKLHRDSGGNPYVITTVRNITEHERIDEVLNNLATSFASIYGTEFFNQVCAHVSEVLNAEYAFVGRLIPGKRRIRVVGGVAMGKPLETIEYDLADTPCAEVVGRKVCIHPANVQKIFPKDSLLAEMRADGYTGIPLRARSGDPLGIFVVMSTKPMIDTDLAVSMMTGYSERVSAEIERTEAEVAQRVAEERFAKVFRYSPDGIAIVSLDTGRYVDVNEGFTTITGYSRAEVIGKSSAEFDLGVDLQTLEQYEGVISTGRALRDIETMLYTKTGGVRRIMVNAEVIDLGGSPHMVSVGRDITEQEEAKKVLESKDQDIRRAYAEVFSAVTDEKLIILTHEEIEAACGKACSDTFAISSFAQLAESRRFFKAELAKFRLSEDLVSSLILASGEAVANGVKHAGSCEAQVCSLDGTVQLKIWDKGPGINFKDLPRATLLPGYSTKKSLGMGFALILNGCDRVILSTGPEGTTVLLESGGRKADDTLDDILARSLDKHLDTGGQNEKIRDL